MRTDVDVNTTLCLRLPEIPLGSPGRPAHAGRGDWIEWSIDNLYFRGRVIGVIEDAPEDGGPFLVVAMQMLSGDCCERWVRPSDVVDCREIISEEKAAWVWGEAFLDTSVDKARRCFNLTVEDME